MNRLMSGNITEEDVEITPNLRPYTLQSFIGQTRQMHNLKVFLNAAKERNEALDHVIIYGPPGLGKTTLSHIIATEMESNIKVTAGPILTKVGDLAAILTNLQKKRCTIHRRNSSTKQSCRRIFIFSYGRLWA